jgi:hypothetical protein
MHLYAHSFCTRDCPYIEIHFLSFHNIADELQLKCVCYILDRYPLGSAGRALGVYLVQAENTEAGPTTAKSSA